MSDDLRPKGGLDEHHGPALAGVGDQGVAYVDEGVAVRRPDAVEQQVHRGQPCGAVDQLVAGDELVAEVLALGGREAGGVAGGVLVGDEEEAAGAAGGVDDRVSGLGVDDVDDRPDQLARREVLPGAGALVGSALGQQLLVGVSLEVGARGRPVLLVDEVDDESLELGRVLDPVLGLPEDRAERARLLCETDQDLGVGDLQLGAFGVEELLPRVLGRHDLLRVQPPGSPLVRHLEEQQVGQLLGVLDDAHAVVAQDVAVGPELVDEAA